MAEIVFNEVPVTTKVGGGRATPEEIVAIGRRFWQRIQSSGVAAEDDDGNDRLLDSLQKEFKDFTSSFPIIVRWAVQMRKFSSTALDKYLRLHATADLSSREGFLRLQAEYLVILFREDNARRHDEKAVQAYRTALVKQLLEEDEQFQKLQEEAEKESKAKEQALDAERRRNLYRFVLAQKVKGESAGSTSSTTSSTNAGDA